MIGFTTVFVRLPSDILLHHLANLGNVTGARLPPRGHHALGGSSNDRAKQPITRPLRNRGKYGSMKSIYICELCMCMCIIYIHIYHQQYIYIVVFYMFGASLKKKKTDRIQVNIPYYSKYF